MFQKIIVYVIGVIVAIPILLWLAIRGIFEGGWKLLCFVCQRQYRELKRLCEHGTAAELQAFLAVHPGARKYVIYTCQGRTTALITSFFSLPSPLAVAGRANNLAVIPVLLANGAAPNVCNVSEVQTPVEEAIGAPDRMRALCSGKTWWREHSDANDAMLEAAFTARNHRGILWHALRGATLISHEQLHSYAFLRLPPIMKEFVCRFAVREKLLEEFHHNLNQLSAAERKRICNHRFHSPVGPKGISLHKEFDEMLRIVEKSLQPLPSVSDAEVDNLMFSAGLMGRPQVLGLLDQLFTQDQQFSLLKRFLETPLTDSNRELTEEAVDLLLCSILAKAGA